MRTASSALSTGVTRVRAAAYPGREHGRGKCDLCACLAVVVAVGPPQQQKPKSPLADSVFPFFGESHCGGHAGIGERRTRVPRQEASIGDAGSWRGF